VSAAQCVIFLTCVCQTVAHSLCPCGRVLYTSIAASAKNGTINKRQEVEKLLKDSQDAADNMVAAFAGTEKEEDAGTAAVYVMLGGCFTALLAQAVLQDGGEAADNLRSFVLQYQTTSAALGPWRRTAPDTPARKAVDVSRLLQEAAAVQALPQSRDLDAAMAAASESEEQAAVEAAGKAADSESHSSGQAAPTTSGGASPRNVPAISSPAPAFMSPSKGAAATPLALPPVPAKLDHLRGRERECASHAW
jgi:hypothetical protein